MDFDIFGMESGGPYGVCHGDETYLQFSPYNYDFVAEGLNDADLKVSKTILDLWKNFIITGNPSTEGEFIYLNYKYRPSYRT